MACCSTLGVMRTSSGSMGSMRFQRRSRQAREEFRSSSGAYAPRLSMNLALHQCCRMSPEDSKAKVAGRADSLCMEIHNQTVLRMLVETMHVDLADLVTGVASHIVDMHISRDLLMQVMQSCSDLCQDM
mmetsp:Transcript_48797/g.116001  ORF Transcript_48797/g.116001 Transcript_48797/m.116001 type:complete len:129 (+) Transcript_48797:273-659(+)